jgi:CMP-N-acetylneuraminic acid synthetase
MDVNPRFAATQASRSLASSSRTWFSTGISNTGFFNVLSFLSTATAIIHECRMLLQPTSPIRNPVHIDKAVNMLWESEKNVVNLARAIHEFVT